jgi:hypothetical protein
LDGGDKKCMQNIDVEASWMTEIGKDNIKRDLREIGCRQDRLRG